MISNNTFETVIHCVKNHRGELHCETGPAEITSKGIERYFQWNKLHRLDGPAIIANKNFYKKPEIKSDTKDWIKNIHDQKSSDFWNDFHIKTFEEQWYIEGVEITSLSEYEKYQYIQKWIMTTSRYSAHEKMDLIEKIQYYKIKSFYKNKDILEFQKKLKR